MTLEIGQDSRFTWKIAKHHAEKDNCSMTTTQMKHGHVSQEGGKAIFAVEDGTESFEPSCGRRGSSKLAPTSEQYDVQLGVGRMVLQSGSIRWAFLRS